VVSDDRNPYPRLDLNDLIGLTTDDAVARARANGVDRIGLIGFIDDEMVGAIDAKLAPRRHDLRHQKGHVVFAALPSVRSAGVWPQRAQ
jgi:hypothetical protein